MSKKIILSLMTGTVLSAVSAIAKTTDTESAAPVAVVSAEEINAQNTPNVAELLERVTALETAAAEEKESKITWPSKIKFKGDLRYRYENIKVGGHTRGSVLDPVTGDDIEGKNRQRIRVRLGAYADVNDFTTAGIRIRTGQGANSGNQTIGGSWDGKGVFFDLAYVTLAPEEGEYGAVTLGKMKYPWKVTTDLIWDSDVNPEGLAYTYATKVEDTGLFGSAGYFKVEEDSSTHDLNLASIQAGITQPLGEKSKATLGGSYFYYDNSQDFGWPVNFGIAEGFGEVGFKDVLCVPFKLYGNYVNNTEIGDDDEGYCAGIKFGDAKKGKWEAKVGYRRLEANAAPSPFVDSDYAGGGTDVKGTRIKAKYNVAKHLQLGFTGIAGERISSKEDVNTLHLDVIASF